MITEPARRRAMKETKMLEWIVPVAIGAAALGCFDRPKNQCNHTYQRDPEDSEAGAKAAKEKAEKAARENPNNGHKNTKLKFGSYYMTASGESVETAMEVNQSLPEPKNGELVWCSMYEYFAYRLYECTAARAENGHYRLSRCPDSHQQGDGYYYMASFKHLKDKTKDFSFSLLLGDNDFYSPFIHVPREILLECCVRHNKDNSFNWVGYLEAYYKKVGRYWDPEWDITRPKLNKQQREAADLQEDK